MAKRFTDTDLWEKEWFMQLSPKLKCLTRFIYDRCDGVGVWSPNWTMASMFIGEKVGIDDLAQIDEGKQFEVLENGKIFIPDFCEFQYGQLTEKCKPHIKWIRELKKHGLFERVSKGYRKGINTLEEKEKEKEEEKDFGKSENLLSENEQSEVAASLMPHEKAKTLMLADEKHMRWQVNHLKQMFNHELTEAQWKKWIERFFLFLQGEVDNMRPGVVAYQTWFVNWLRVRLKHGEIEPGVRTLSRYQTEEEKNQRNLPAYKYFNSK